MLLKRNLLETITFVSSSGTIICILLNYITDISPFSGIWFHGYALLLFFISVSLSFRFIQWLLHLNKPLKYDLDGLAKNCPYLSFLAGVLPRLPERKEVECKEYDTNELSVISTVLERRLVSSWYMPYVSEEIGFPFACKQLLDQMISKTFQICNKIETKDVYVDICTVLTNHLKEYKKALKRHEKSQSSSIESLYKKSHLIFNKDDKKYQPADHCTNILRIILKELVPWELWDTPHSELLVRILSKKLDSFIGGTLADPVWLNDKLMMILKGEQPLKTEKNSEESELIDEDAKIQEAKLQKTEEEEKVKELPKEMDVPIPETTTIESALSTLITKSTAPILHRAIDLNDLEAEAVEEIDSNGGITGTEPVDIGSSPVMRQRRGRQGRNEVKIYDRIIEGSVKTWETDVDLQCVSLGQDLLAGLNGEITLSRLWGQDGDTDSAKNDGLWFGEEDAIDMELETSPKTQSPTRKDMKPSDNKTDQSPKPDNKAEQSLKPDNKAEQSLKPDKAEQSPKPDNKAEQSPKPAEILLKDLQTTVHHAKSKIGDLQVTSVDVHNKNDEAAGMMEGLLDFGIAGLKKGLRFTGLSDDSQDKSPSQHKEKTTPPEAKPKPALVREQVTTSLLQREDNGLPPVPQLVKQHRIASQDSVPSLPRPIPVGTGGHPSEPLSESPEPQYEEAADLSTSIAKLRCLLNQRAAALQGNANANGAEEVWWESAAETRGRTHCGAHSARTVDTATLADEYDMTMDRNTSPNQTSNNMQRLDKLFHRTVTGVFNSIKTAVGGDEDPAGDGPPLPQWGYACTAVELSVGCAVARLVGSRRAYNHVDAALDSLDHLTVKPQKKEIVPEDFEEWCMAYGCLWCGLAELGAAAGLCSTHLTFRTATLLFADISETLITHWLDELSSWLRAQVFIVFEDLAAEKSEPEDQIDRTLRELNVDETCEAVMERIPALSIIFGSETATEAVKLVISSFAHKQINQDVLYRVLDLYALHFKTSAGLRNPSFDNN